MKNMQPSSSGGHSDYSEKKEAQRFEAKRSSLEKDSDQLTLDYLLHEGFMWEEAVLLLHMREHLYENKEMRQRVTDDHRMHFVRWLYAHGEMNEG